MRLGCLGSEVGFILAYVEKTHVHYRIYGIGQPGEFWDSG